MKILRFWGIPINKIFSDDDVVDNVRKNLKQSKKYVWFHIAMLILICLCFPMLWDAVMFTTKQIPEKDRMMSWLGMIIGFSTGIFIAQYVMIAGLTILVTLNLFDYNRGNKLLVKYHDMLKENGLLEEDDEQQDGHIFVEENNDIRSS